jgi:polygalacturonase
MPIIQEPLIPEATFSVADYGAVSGGEPLNTAAFQRAIDACALVGGGTVHIPPGLWLTGPLELKSRVRLHAEKGALVSFSRDPAHYPLRVGYWEGETAVRCQPPISGTGLKDIAITGEGIFDGNGGAWRPVKDWKMTAKQWTALLASGGVIDPETNIWWPDEGALQGEKAVGELRKSGCLDASQYEPSRTYLRPVLLGLYGCERVLLSSATFQNSPAWNLHLLECEHVTLRGVQVRNPWFAQNGDGLDLESCRYALVEDCTFDVGDDAICMKSGKDEEGRRRGKPVEYVTVRGCTVFHGHGGFVVGSEMSGGARHLLVEDCTFIGTDVGLRFKSTRGRGGVVEHVVIRRIRMKDIAGPAISFNLYYGQKDGDAAEAVPAPVSEETPEFRHISIEDTVCEGAERAIELIGLPERPLRDIRFRRVRLSAKEGARCVWAEDVAFHDTHIRAGIGEAWVFEGCQRIIQSP